MTLQLWPMPLTVFSVKGLAAHRRERVKAAVVAGGKHARGPHEAWIAMDPRGMVRVLMTGPDSFERSVGFAPDDDAAVLAELPVAEYTALQIKQAVVGHGKAAKVQVHSTNECRLPQEW